MTSNPMLSTRLQKSDVEYILKHSGAKLIFVDHEYADLVHGTNLPVILSHDTGRFGDPYEDFLAHGRAFSNERGWEGLDLEPDENANCALNYTCVIFRIRPPFTSHSNF